MASRLEMFHPVRQTLYRLWTRLPILLRGTLALAVPSALGLAFVYLHLSHQANIREILAGKSTLTYEATGVPRLLETNLRRLFTKRSINLLDPVLTADIYSPEDKEIAAVSRFGSLQRLGIADGLLTTEGLQRIRALKNLEALFLENDCIDGACLNGLPSCPRLKKLKIVGQLTPEALSPLSRCQSLKELHLNGGIYDHIGTSMLQRRLTAHHLQAVARIPNLQRLVLLSNDLSDIDLGALEGANQLEELWIDTVVLNGDGLNRLGQLPRLKTLILEVSSTRPESLQNLSGFPSLKTLALRGVAVHGAHLARLKSIPHLETLCLESACLVDTIEPLANLRRLKYLNVYLAELPSDGLAQMGRSDTLVELGRGMNNPEIGWQELRQLFPNLERLDLGNGYSWTQNTDIPKWNITPQGMGAGFF